MSVTNPGLPLAALLLLAGCQPPQDVGYGDAREDPLQPGGKYLTYEPDLRSSAPLLQAYDPEPRRVIGKALFYRDWLVASQGAPVLGGPDYDESTCWSCHVETAPDTHIAPEAPMRLIARPVTEQHRAAYGPQLSTHRLGSDGPEAIVNVEYRTRIFTYPDGETRTLHLPIAHAVTENGEIIPVGLRAAPLLFGWGLLEKVDPTMIAYYDDPDDANGDGISGRLVRLGSAVGNEPPRVALFGLKNAHASLRAQITSALANDMGVMTGVGCTSGCSTEIEPRELEALTDYVRYLGVPDRRRTASERGRNLFGQSGCTACHVSVMITIPDAAPELANQLIWPYSDLVLHDMGPGLSDPGDLADAREWRTAPLWGLGIIERRFPQRGFLHDGRAKTIEEAILWHGGEAESAQRSFVSLSKEDRQALLQFVRSL